MKFGFIYFTNKIKIIWHRSLKNHLFYNIKLINIIRKHKILKLIFIILKYKI